MLVEDRKLQLIEAILKIEDAAILQEVAAFVDKNKLQIAKNKRFQNFEGTLTDEEANEMLKAIDEGCEQINPDDWK